MSGRGPRSFRYGARLAVTAPLALVFLVVGAEMVMLAIGASLYWRIAYVTLGALAILLALSMVREVVVRLRGKRRVVVTARELTVPSTDRGSPAVTIPFRDIRKLELSAGPGFKRVLKIGHVGGELEISGVMLGSVGELDEIHGLIKAARKTR
ncbi:MAG TPA: hypothetical protein VFQ65_27405 [Kofleriaceae bacterium]|nr:hypothetical protein [Kofleriaceae bacterium]